MLSSNKNQLGGLPEHTLLGFNALNWMPTFLFRESFDIGFLLF